MWLLEGMDVWRPAHVEEKWFCTAAADKFTFQDITPNHEELLIFLGAVWASD